MSSEKANMRRPRVVFWNNIPAPYMVDRFNALADRGYYDFEVWFSRRHGQGRSWNIDERRWRFKWRYMPGIRMGRHVITFPFLIFRLNRADVMVGFYFEVAGLLGILLAMARGVRTIVNVDGVSGWAKRRRWKERIKRVVFSKVDGVCAAGTESSEYAISYGSKPERVFPLRHVVDGDFFATRSDHARVADRDALRSSLGLRGVVFVYVGRLWWGKGINTLLEAFCRLQAELRDPVSLLLLGDGPEERALRRKCEELNIRNVVFAGFRQKPDLPLFYAAADVFVFPTLGDPYGLVVDEAMACALPVISTDAAGEIRDRVIPGVNGYIVPAENSPAMSGAMKTLAQDAHLRSRMGGESRRLMQGSSPERWARDFEAIVGIIVRGSGHDDRANNHAKATHA